MIDVGRRGEDGLGVPRRELQTDIRRAGLELHGPTLWGPRYAQCPFGTQELARKGDLVDLGRIDLRFAGTVGGDRAGLPPAPQALDDLDEFRAATVADVLVGQFVEPELPLTAWNA
jgi:hypothetical protein